MVRLAQNKYLNLRNICEVFHTGLALQFIPFTKLCDKLGELMDPWICPVNCLMRIGMNIHINEIKMIGICGIYNTSNKINITVVSGHRVW